MLQKQQFDPCILQDIGHTGRAVLEIKRHHYQPQTHSRLIHNDPGRTVAQHYGHSVARHQCLAFQRRLPAHHLVLHLRPRVIAPIAVLLIELAVGNSIRRAPDALAKKPAYSTRGCNWNDIRLLQILTRVIYKIFVHGILINKQVGRELRARCHRIC